VIPITDCPFALQRTLALGDRFGKVPRDSRASIF
jgi:hypothetical protein